MSTISSRKNHRLSANNLIQWLFIIYCCKIWKYQTMILCKKPESDDLSNIWWHFSWWFDAQSLDVLNHVPNDVTSTIISITLMSYNISKVNQRKQILYFLYLRNLISNTAHIPLISRIRLNHHFKFLHALKDDVVNIETNKNIKKSYNFHLSWKWVF